MRKSLPEFKSLAYCHYEDTDRQMALFSFWAYARGESKNRVPFLVTQGQIELISDGAYNFTISAVCNECLEKGHNLADLYDRDDGHRLRV